MSRERKARRDARKLMERKQFGEMLPMGSLVYPAQLLQLIRNMTLRGALVELDETPCGGMRIRLSFKN